jgi:sulfur-oxidizing protein SoxZ
MAARISVPAQVRKGEVVRIGILIQHAMETGYRLDGANQRVAKNVIRSLVCTLNGTELFRAELSPGIAANPFIQFPAKLEEGGELQFSWVDDAGEKGAASQSVKVI